MKMKIGTTMLVILMITVSCNRTTNKPLIRNFQEELTSFLDMSKSIEGNKQYYCLLLFKDKPDSTVSFILTIGPHVLTGYHHEIKVKSYYKDGVTLIVNSSKGFAFESLFNGWEPIEVTHFNEQEVQVLLRADYVIKDELLHKIPKYENDNEGLAFQFFKNRESNSYFFINCDYSHYAEYCDANGLWIGSYLEGNGTITFIPNWVVYKNSIDSGHYFCVEKNSDSYDSIVFVCNGERLLKMEDNVFFPSEVDTVFFDRVLNF